MTLLQHIRKHVVLAVPVMVGQLGHIMVSVADTAMVGRVGVIPLAGATFANTIYHVLLLFGIGFSYALTPLIASTDPKDRSKLHEYLGNGLVLNLSIAVVMIGIGFIMSFFLDYFGQDPDVVTEARPYLLIMIGTMLPLMAFQSLRQYSEGLSDTLRPMIVSVIANLVNVGLNYVLIFGKFGFPAYGLVGAGVASLISRIVMFIIMAAVLYPKWKGLIISIKYATINRIARIGFGTGMQYVFEIGAFAVAAIMVGWISPEALAAHQIALNLSAITYMAATGIAAASTIRVSNQLGLKDLKNLKVAGFSGFGLVISFMAFCGLIFVLFRHTLVTFYIEETEVRLLAAQLLIIAAAFQISDGTQAVGLGVLRGLTDIKIPTLVTFIAFWLFAIPASYLLGFVFDLGITGIWYALLASLTLAAVLHLLRFNWMISRLNF